MSRPAAKGVRAPDRTEEVIGFRAWGVRIWAARPPQLISLYRSTIWPRDDWLLADCDKDEAEAIPHESCNCGIHAARDRLHLVEQGYNERGELPILGEVGLSGRIIPGKTGWRAEKARPVRLLVPYGEWRLVKPLQEAYQIQVELTNPHSEEE